MQVELRKKYLDLPIRCAVTGGALPWLFRSKRDLFWLLYAAREALGDNVPVVTVRTPSYPGTRSEVGSGKQGARTGKYRI